VPHDPQHEQLDQIRALVKDVLGSDTVGIYLYGSAVMGGLRPRSDLDVLVVSRRRTSRDEKRRLVDKLLAISARRTIGTLRPIELTLVVESEIRPWHYPPAFDFEYGEWLRPKFESGNIEPWPSTTNPDLTSRITMVLLRSATLFGPAPTGTFDPIPARDYISAIVGGIDSLLGDLEMDMRNVVLTLARIWSSVATGDVRSKDQAADWALPRLPEEHQAVLARARAIYFGEEEERWEDIKPRVRPYADYVVAEIDRISGLRTTTHLI
jgi:streptomycin 3"-adenylyltransferase